jgi:hypothetical protein
MQFAKANKDWLIFAPSLSAEPVFCVCVARSDPAKSMRQIRECIRLLSGPARWKRDLLEGIAVGGITRSSVKEKTAWEREERAFAAVASTFRALWPVRSCWKASSALCTDTSRKFITLTTPFFSSSRTLQMAPPS